VPSANPATNKFGPILLGSQWQPMLYWTLPLGLGFITNKTNFLSDFNKTIGSTIILATTLDHLHWCHGKFKSPSLLGLLITNQCFWPG